MGFKDWGCWNLVQDVFTLKQMNFAKFNVSHNGTSLNNQTEFVDLGSFSINSYWKELEDLTLFINHLESKYNRKKIHLIGHSRGGGTVLLASRHKNVKSITTWAAISDIAKRIPNGDKLKDWQEKEFYYVKNGRTSQEMPHHISQLTDFIEHQEVLNIKVACENLTKPLCVIHGTDDDSVNISESEEIANNANVIIHKIEDANHTFDSKHPWENIYLPKILLNICNITLRFIEKTTIHE